MKKYGYLLFLLVMLQSVMTPAAFANKEVYFPNIWPNVEMYDHYLVLRDGAPWPTWYFKPTTGGNPGGFNFVYGGEGTNFPSDDQFYHEGDKALFRYRFNFGDGKQLWYVWPMAMAPLVWDGNPWSYEGVTTAILLQDGHIVAGPIEARYRTTIYGWEYYEGKPAIHWSQEWLDPQPLSEWTKEDVYFAELPVYGGLITTTAWGPRTLKVRGQDGNTGVVYIDHWQKR